MNLQQINRLAAIALILLASAPIARSQSKVRKQVVAPASEAEQKQLAETASQSRATLIAASNAYRESLERVLELQQQEEARAAEVVEKRKALLGLGAISKREIEEAEQALAAAQARASEMRKQIEDADRLMAEVSVAEQPVRAAVEPRKSFRTTNALVRYVGASHWALSDFGKVDAFFRLKFGRPLPVSAMGQSETHNRLGFDHRQAIDVAVHPDSDEGEALIAYLRAQGISFIAIRVPIRGSATGAHIHIGQPSKRMGS